MNRIIFILLFIQLFGCYTNFGIVLGVGKDEYFIASDSSPIINHTRNIIVLDEGEIANISKEGYEIRKIENNDLLSKEIEMIEHSIDEIEKGEFPHFMLKEIYEQPNSLTNSIRGRIDYKNNSIKLGGLNDWTQKIKEANTIIEILN